MAAGTERPQYRHAGVLLVRATTTYPGEAALPELPDLSGDAEAMVRRASAWLVQVWQCDEVRRAVKAASPVLSHRIGAVVAGHRPDSRRLRRLVSSLAAYLLRWQGRATPFGLFSGVGAAHVGSEPIARWGEAHWLVARADAQWLGEVISRLERHPVLLERLRVTANTAAFTRGERIVVPGRPPEGSPGGLAPLEVSVRHTRPVRTAVAAANEPIGFGDLLKRLAVDHPSTPLEQISAMLAELVTQNILLTNLQTPMTVPDALGHMCAQLDAAGTEELADLAGRLHELRAIHDGLARHNHHATSAAQSQTIRTAVSDRMKEVCSVVAQPLVLDTGLDCEITVPEAVIGEAETAACALLRLTPYPFGYPHWKDFHFRFRQRYGPGAVVPISELVADTGLGLPAGYLGSPLGRPARTLTGRDEALLELIQQSMIEGGAEIVLTEPVIRALTVGDPAETLPPPRTELAFQIQATSPEDLARGTFRLMVTAAPRPGASMAGRFADLLPGPERERLAQTYTAVSAGAPDAVTAQLSFPPRRRRSENVVRAPQLLDHTISVSEHHAAGSGRIELGDLAVSADARQLCLVQLSSGRRVEPQVLHALESGTLTPPLARFLAEVTTARCAVYTAFDWGAAAHLTYLPRLRYGRAVLSPARWILRTSDLPTRTAPQSEWEWEAALDSWRARLGVPASVTLCESEQRLPLDLARPGHKALLRTRLERASRVELREALTPEDLAWAGRAHELLLPLHLTRTQTPESQPRTTLRPAAVERDAGHLPGRSPWLYARIYGHPQRQDEILTEYLPRLLGGWDGEPLWWFRRHRDTTHPDREQCLGLYLRLPSPEHYGQAAERLGEWAADLRALGLVPQLQLATYHPETGRYGHGEAMAAAEEAFAADSAAALAQIELAARTSTPAEAITAAGLVDLAASYSDTPAEGLRWLIDNLPHHKGHLEPSLRDTALRLTDPLDDWAQLRTHPGAQSVVLAWQQRRLALATYRDRLRRQRDPHPVLRSLLHLHHVRTLAVDADRERLTHRLARAAALRQDALKGQVKQ